MNADARYGNRKLLASVLTRWAKSGVHLITAKLDADGRKNPYAGQKGFVASERKHAPRVAIKDILDKRLDIVGYRPGTAGLVHFDIDERTDKGSIEREAVERDFPGALVEPSAGGRGFHAIYALPKDMDKWDVVGRKYKWKGWTGEVLCMSRWAALTDKGAIARVMRTKHAPLPASMRPLLRVPSPQEASEAPGTDEGAETASEASPAEEWTKPKKDALRQMLPYVNVEDEDDWWKVVGVIYNAFGHKQGWAIADTFSRGCGGNYDLAGNMARWKAFKKGYVRTPMSWVQTKAETGGWKPPLTLVLPKKRIDVVTIDGPGMAALYPEPDTVLYVPERKAAYVFDDHLGTWNYDYGNFLIERNLQNAALAKKIGKKHVRVDNSTIRNGVQSLLRHRQVSEMDFDSIPYICGTPTGVFDLRTLTPRRGRKEEHVSMRLGVTPEKGAHPAFDSMMEFAFEDRELRYYVLCLLASLLGGVRIKSIIFFKGLTNSGKTTLTSLMAHICGSYMGGIPAGAVHRVRGEYKGALHPEWLHRLRDCRSAKLANETKANHILDDAMLNDITGGDRVTARGMHQGSVDFELALKVLMYGNQAPLVDATSGIKTRMKIIPMDRSVPDDELDASLPEKLREEASAVAWTLAALYADRERASEGFLPETPEAVGSASKSYFLESDDRGRFIDQCLIITGDPRDKITPAQLQSSVDSWLESEGIRDNVSAGHWLRHKFSDMPNGPRKVGQKHWGGVQIVEGGTDD